MPSEPTESEGPPPSPPPSLPPTPVEKGLVLNTRTGALYGAATGFAIGLAWQTVAGYADPLPLWRWLIVGGAILGGAFGFGYASRIAPRNGSAD